MCVKEREVKRGRERVWVCAHLDSARVLRDTSGCCLIQIEFHTYSDALQVQFYTYSDTLQVEFRMYSYALLDDFYMYFDALQSNSI